MAHGDAVEQIKERLSIIDVVAPYVELHQAGRNFKGKSPFTNEKTPSFYVSPDKGMYYCFSSSQGGDIFTFVQSMEGVDFKGALKILAEKAGVELVPEDPKKRSERDTGFHILEEATAFFEEKRRNSEAAEAYLANRGVHTETIAKWRIGYAPGPPTGGWRELREHLAAKGHNDAQLLAAGLVKKADEGKEPYDVFRDRVMFPIFDLGGRVIAFSGRILEKDSDAPKYVNSPETDFFNKSEVLYGYDRARQGIRQYDFSLIVEGQFDVVLAHQAGYTNTVAVSGTALTPHHVSLLQRLSNRVVLALDADRAGIAAVKRAAELMLARGIDLKVAQLPEGSDPADLVRDNPKHLREVIGTATHVIEFLLSILKETTKDARTYKLRVRDEVLPYIILINNSIDAEHFESVVAAAIETSTEAVHSEVLRKQEDRNRQHNSRISVSHEGGDGQSVSRPPSVRRVEELKNYLVVAAECIDEKTALILRNALEDLFETSYETLKNAISVTDQSALVFQIESRFDELKEPQVQGEISDRFDELRKRQLESVRRELHTKLTEAEHLEDLEEVARVAAKINTINQVLSRAEAELLFGSKGGSNL